MAVHTGNADERGGDYFGPPLNRCARLLSTGYGGQILVSEVAAHLVRDVLPPGVELADLGSHSLKDLERTEQIYQVVHGGLTASFGELRSEKHVLEASDQVAAGRQAHAAHHWQQAYLALAAAATTLDLDPEDLQRLGRRRTAHTSVPTNPNRRLS